MLPSPSSWPTMPISSRRAAWGCPVPPAICSGTIPSVAHTSATDHVRATFPHSHNVPTQCGGAWGRSIPSRNVPAQCGGEAWGRSGAAPPQNLMDIFVQQVISGLATGGIYASLALALVMIYQATDVVNFAQGSMAMFSTYLCWSLLQAGLPYWVAFFATIVIAFVGGLLIERTVIRPVENAPILTIVIVTLGLVVILVSVAGWIYSYIQKPFPSPFPSKPIKLGQVVLGAHDVGAICVTLVVLVLLFLFFRYTTLGLAMRAAAQDPNSSRLCGIRVGWMLALGWG